MSVREQPFQLFRDGIRFPLLCPTVEARFDRLTISIVAKNGVDGHGIIGSTEGEIRRLTPAFVQSFAHRIGRTLIVIACMPAPP
jgi:hypothetical protein